MGEGFTVESLPRRRSIHHRAEHSVLMPSGRDISNAQTIYSEQVLYTRNPSFRSSLEPPQRKTDLFVTVARAYDFMMDNQDILERISALTRESAGFPLTNLKTGLLV